jgi:hypothetical protein
LLIIETQLSPPPNWYSGGIPDYVADSISSGNNVREGGGRQKHRNHRNVEARICACLWSGCLHACSFAWNFWLRTIYLHGIERVHTTYNIHVHRQGLLVARFCIQYSALRIFLIRNIAYTALLPEEAKNWCNLLFFKFRARGKGGAFRRGAPRIQFRYPNIQLSK